MTRFTASRRGGFSLTELMVAMAVLVICLVMEAQVINLASTYTGSSRNQMDALEQGRFVLDRLGIDIDSRVRLNQVPVQFLKAADNDSLTFYTQNGRDSNARTAVLASYQVALDPATSQPQLQRAVDDVTWTSTNPLPFLPASLTRPTDYQVLSPDVFRFEVTFLRKSTQTLTTTAPSDWSDVAAIVVAVATLDSNSRKLVSAAQWTTLIHQFPDATDGNQILPSWQAQLPTLPSIMPARAAAAVRIYQRFFYVN